MIAHPSRRFVFRLALALGLPVREMLASMGSDELTEWMAYYQLEPFGDYRADYRSGVVASTFANAHRAKDGRHGQKALAHQRGRFDFPHGHAHQHQTDA